MRTVNIKENSIYEDFWRGKNEKKDFSIDNYFMVTSLLFEKEYEVEFDKESKPISVKNVQGELIMPKLILTKKEDVSK